VGRWSRGPWGPRARQACRPLPSLWRSGSVRRVESPRTGGGV